MGGVNIPLLALDVKQPEAPSLLDTLGKASAIKGQQQQQQLVAQQIKDNDAIRQALTDWNPQSSYDDLAHAVVKNGGSGNAAFQIMQHGLAVKKQISDIAKQDADTGGQQLQNLATRHDQALGAIKAAEDVSDDQLGAHVTSTINGLVQSGMLKPEEAQPYAQLAQLPPDQMRQQLKLHEKQLQGEKAQIAQATSEAEQAQNLSKAAGERYKEVNGALMDLQAPGGPKPVNTSALNSGDWGNLVDSVAPPTGNRDLNMRTHAQVEFALKRGDIKGAQQAITEAGNQVGSIEKETNPAVQAAKLHLSTAEKAASEAISDGDPRAAAQLLIDGTVAPSQLISSRKPAFAQQAFTAAAKMQPGWSATKADADYKVASSPANVAFFGSAKSLTDPGGTLDQLKNAADDIPGHRVPIFNSVDDAIRASTGSGPVAKYAALALGVADDYSKVMGGGQGSDTSRTQALKIISASQSPEQRAGSIEGIRGSVGSQTNSRIGDNTVLRKMYGKNVAAPPSGSKAPPVGATHTAMGSDGRRHYTNSNGQDLGIVQ